MHIYHPEGYFNTQNGALENENIITKNAQLGFLQMLPTYMDKSC